MVKVQDGCDRRCAYCIVPDARGGPRSVPADEVLARVRTLVGHGHGRGRADRHQHRTLRRSRSRRGGRCGPRPARRGDGRRPTSRLLHRAAGPHRPLHRGDPLPAAGGPAPARAAAVGLRSHAARDGPPLHVGGVRATPWSGAAKRSPASPSRPTSWSGFPGETDEDFEESLAFVEGCGFAKLHVFRYSRRAGTPAAARADQVAPQVSRGAGRAHARALAAVLRRPAPRPAPARGRPCSWRPRAPARRSAPPRTASA